MLPEHGCKRSGSYKMLMAMCGRDGRVVSRNDAPKNFWDTKLARGWVEFEAEVCCGCERYVPIETEGPKEYHRLWPKPPRERGGT